MGDDKTAFWSILNNCLKVNINGLWIVENPKEGNQKYKHLK